MPQSHLRNFRIQIVSSFHTRSDSPSLTGSPLEKFAVSRTGTKNSFTAVWKARFEAIAQDRRSSCRGSSVLRGKNRGRFYVDGTKVCLRVGRKTRCRGNSARTVVVVLLEVLQDSEAVKGVGVVTPRTQTQRAHTCSRMSACVGVVESRFRTGAGTEGEFRKKNLLLDAGTATTCRTSKEARHPCRSTSRR